MRLQPSVPTGPGILFIFFETNNIEALKQLVKLLSQKII
jgi:hypothetical protein